MSNNHSNPVGNEDNLLCVQAKISSLEPGKDFSIAVFYHGQVTRQCAVIACECARRSGIRL